MPWVSSLSVLLNVYYYKKNEYIWFRGGDLNSSRDIKLLVEGVGHARAATDGLPSSSLSALLNAYFHKKNINIYGLGVGIGTVSKILSFL